MRQLAVALLLALACLCAPVAAAPRIGVMTMGPGTEYWSRFGHNAIIVERDDGRRLSYNYGYFDFEQPGFLLRFLRGQMRYRLVALPFEDDLDIYRREGRSAVLQWLDLEPQAAQAAADYLAWNALPENAEYRYDYFRDNCSTRVRDIVDRASGGLLKQQVGGRSRGLSERSEAMRLAAPDLWMYLGVHLLLAEPADRPLSRWGEGFVPQRLHDALALVRRADGRPLVASEQALLPQRVAAARGEEPRFGKLAAVLGIAFAALALAFARRPGVAGGLVRLLLASAWTLAGLAGLLMLALWLGSEHSAAWANRNLLLFPPTCLGLAWSTRFLAVGLRDTWPRRLAQLHLLGWIAALGAYLLSVRDQDTLEWLLLSGPLHLAALALFAPASATDDPLAAPGGTTG